MILQGVADGLRENGKDVQVFPLSPGDPMAVENLRKDLFSYQPDAIFLANHPANLFLKQIGLQNQPCPVFVWVLDDPFMMGGEEFSPDEIILAADPSFIPTLRKRGGKRIFFLPVAAPAKINCHFAEEYHLPVVYVGSTLRLQQFQDQMSQELKTYFDQMTIQKLQNPDIPFEFLLREYPFKNTQSIQYTGQVAYYLYTEANRLSRTRYLESLAGMGLSLYGNENWRQEIKHTALEKCFRGSIDPLYEYPNLIHSAAININLRSLQGFSAPIHRDFLVPLAGGFLVSSRKISSFPKIVNLKETGEDVSVSTGQDMFELDEFPWSSEAKSPEEMPNLVQHYLANSNARRAWIEHARNIILKNHTYSRRVQQLGQSVDSL